jgi:Acetyltransferase (GNAT) domain
VLERGGRLIGFAGSRAFGKGYVIGPVVAPTIVDAKALLTHFMAGREQRFIRVDTAAAAELGPWLADKGLVHVDDGIVMQRPVIRQSADLPFTTFALASQALG